jgi:hypothetical protein
MAISVLDSLKDRQGNTRKSANWYRNAVSSIADRVTARKLMSSGKLTVRPSIGRLNMFFYDPKYKKTLPYYDTFPLVLPLERIPGGFAGINFHYLNYAPRFTLLERLQSFATGSKLDKKTTFDVSYGRVKGIKLVKGTIKKYLFDHVRSSFLRVDFDEAAIAVYLPVAQFKKGSPY